MFRFAEINYLYLLYLIPVILVLFWYSHRIQKKTLQSFATEKMQHVLLPLRSLVKNIMKYSMATLALVFIIFTLANPQVGTKIEEVKQVGIDVFILLDVSLSMQAEDIKPSRLEKAKHDIAKLIQKLRGDRIGLIVFSGNAYVQFPLTTDYSAANLFLNAADVSSVPQAGTAIGSAISLAQKSFKQDEDTKKAIIVITDGEDHEGDLDKLAEEAVKSGIDIYAIGLGSPAGVPIPTYNTGGAKTGYKKDRQGNVVLTKLDEATLQQLALTGNGKYYRATNSDDILNEIYNDLAKLDQTEFGATKITEYEDRYYFFLFPALLLLIIEFFIPGTKSRLFMKLNK